MRREACAARGLVVRDDPVGLVRVVGLCGAELGAVLVELEPGERAAQQAECLALGVSGWGARVVTYGARRALKHAGAAVLDRVEERGHERELHVVRDGVREVEGA